MKLYWYTSTQRPRFTIQKIEPRPSEHTNLLGGTFIKWSDPKIIISWED